MTEQPSHEPGIEVARAVIKGLQDKGYDIVPRWKCGARQRNIGPEIQDCDWPICGCDPFASRVLDAISESGFKIVKDDPVLGSLLHTCSQPTRDELLYLADQEQHERGMLQIDNHGDRRASLVKEWALRESAARQTL
jgi:hypothetical protein